VAITVANLVTAASGTDATSYVTASITPTANALVLAFVHGTDLTGSAQPTLSGNGLTWVAITTVQFNTIAAPEGRLTVFRAMGAAPSAGAVTIAFGAVEQNGCSWSIVQATGDVDTSGTNGSGAIVQSQTAQIDASINVTVTLPAPIAPGNVPVAGVGQSSSVAMNPEAGWTELGEAVHSLPAAGIQSAWRNNSDDVSYTAARGSGTASWGAIIVEVKAAGGSSPHFGLFSRALSSRDILDRPVTR
jgi:hypothetical protein